jgi:hypothetical protein
VKKMGHHCRLNQGENTTRNTVMGCTLSEAVLHEPQLKYYQQLFISSWPFRLLGAGLSEAVLHVEPLLIIFKLSASVQNMNRHW